MKFAHALLLFFVVTGSAFGFMPNPDMLTISPAISKAGATVEVKIAGKALDEARTLRFSDPRIVAKQVLLPADEFHPKPRPVANKFTVSIPADIEPGVYEVRSKGYFGLSTARPFVVFPKNSAEVAGITNNFSKETAANLDLETGVIGTMDSGKLDWFKFTAKKGERLLFNVLAERLDSKGDAIVTVYDSGGRELESSRLHFGRDPFVDFTPAEDGEYFVTLSDGLFQGGKDYFYHLRITRGPHIDFVFPPAGEPGQKRRFTVFGRNLPGGSLGENWALGGKPIETKEVELQVPAEVVAADSFHWSIPRQSALPAFDYQIENSQPVRIGFATAPVVMEDSKADDQKIAVPSEVAGRFDQPGDADTFRISAKKGQTYWIDVMSHRLGAITDPFVEVEKITVDNEGKETFKSVAKNDDLETFFGRDAFDDLNADSHDPSLSFSADADSDYRISLINQSAGGSIAHLYRLAVREAKHDFQLLAGTELTKTINNDAFPAAPLLRRGGSMVYRIIAFRQDGFEGDITVTAKGLPAGVTAKPLVLSGGTRQGFLALWAAPDAAEWGGPIEIVGTSKIGDAEIARTASSASIVWGKRVFGYATQVRSRLDMETVLSVIDSEEEPTRMAVAEDKVWKVEMKKTLEIPIKLTETGRRTGNLQVNVHGFPGLHRSPPTVAIAEKETEAVIKVGFTPSSNFALEPGRYQFVLRGVGNAKYSQNPAAMKRTEAESKRLEALKGKSSTKAADAKKSVAAAEKVLVAAKQKEAAAADDQARTTLKEETAEAQKQVDAAKKLQVAADAEVKKVTSLHAAAVKEAKAAETVAKEKTNQFATYSQPITVEVLPEPEKKK